MKRVVVLGGQGLFGRTVIQQLTALGISSLVAGRRPPADILIDADDPVSIKAGLSAGDLVIDTAGPFQQRSLALLHAAMEIGFDVIDINDNLRYAEQALALEKEIAGAGIRVLSSASSVSAVAAALICNSHVNDPVGVTGFLAPASRHTANRGSALSLIQSVGGPVQTFRQGQLQSLRGWSEQREFPMPAPLGPISGRLFESADAVYLPRIWPSLHQVEMYVDTNTLGVNTLLRLAARFPALRHWLERRMSFAVRVSRAIGSKIGGIGYEIEAPDGSIVRMAAYSVHNSFMIALAPAVLAAPAIFADRFEPTGLVLPHRHINFEELVDYLKSFAIEIVEVP
jgi:NAD(P)-dependent dehydrogenase (short-subunit alcohol dehydrogenase family)